MRFVKKKRHPNQMGGKRAGAGRPPTQNLAAEFENLDGGEVPEFKVSACFPSMKAAAHTLKIDMAILKDARARDCPAFRTGGSINREQLLAWLKKQNDGATPSPYAYADEVEQEEAEGNEGFTENYDIPDETGGVGQALKSLQAYERRCKRALDQAEKASLLPTLKAELVKQKQDAWIKVVNALLKYDISVSLAKRESGELIPLADAQKGIQALLAWHTVAQSDALRNIIPGLEGKTKYEIAALLDPALRSAIERNFKLGMKLQKIPDWMGKAAIDHVKSEPPLAKTALSPKEPVDLNGF